MNPGSAALPPRANLATAPVVRRRGAVAGTVAVVLAVLHQLVTAALIAWIYAASVSLEFPLRLLWQVAPVAMLLGPVAVLVAAIVVLIRGSAGMRVGVVLVVVGALMTSTGLVMTVDSGLENVLMRVSGPNPNLVLSALGPELAVFPLAWGALLIASAGPRRAEAAGRGTVSAYVAVHLALLGYVAVLLVLAGFGAAQVSFSPRPQLWSALTVVTPLIAVLVPCFVLVPVLIVLVRGNALNRIGVLVVLAGVLFALVPVAVDVGQVFRLRSEFLIGFYQSPVFPITVPQLAVIPIVLGSLLVGVGRRR